MPDVTRKSISSITIWVITTLWIGSAVADCASGPFPVSPQSIADFPVGNSPSVSAERKFDQTIEFDRIRYGVKVTETNLRQGIVIHLGFDVERKLFVYSKSGAENLTISSRKNGDHIRQLPSYSPPIWQVTRLIQASGSESIAMACLLNNLVKSLPISAAVLGVHVLVDGEIVMPGRRLDFTTYEYSEQIKSPIFKMLHEFSDRESNITN